MGHKPRSTTNANDVKTKANDKSVPAFLASVVDEGRRADCYTILRMMEEATGEKPRMWGTSIVGFGQYHYQYASGRQGDWMRIGFSPRKQSLTLYCMAGFKDLAPLLARLGKGKHSVSCLYLPRLEDVDHSALQELIARSVERMAELYPHE